MCFAALGAGAAGAAIASKVSGSNKIPESPSVVIPPTPIPSPSPTQISPQESQSDAARRSRRDQLRYGLLSTIKTSRGLFGTGPQLAGVSTGKDKLG